jgi:hypothetical protein
MKIDLGKGLSIEIVRANNDIILALQPFLVAAGSEVPETPPLLLPLPEANALSAALKCMASPGFTT